MMAAFQEVAARRIARGAPLSRLEELGTPLSDSEWSLSREYTAPLSSDEIALIHAGGAVEIDIEVQS